MYVYNCRIFVMYNREVASFAVLGDDNPIGVRTSYGYRLGRKVGLRFPVVKLLDYAARRPELEQSHNPFATVVLAHLDTQETRQDLGERKDRKFRLVKGLLERGWDAERVRQLFNLIDWLMELPRRLENRVSQEVTKYKEEKRMPFINTFAEGRDGAGPPEDIETILEARFPEASSQLMSEIRQIPDREQLTKILHAAATVAGPDELRKLWTN